MKNYFVAGGSGTRIYCEESGNIHGRSILFIHGLSQSRLSWTKQINSDLAEEFRLITMDLRGHGLSEKPRSGYDKTQNWADDIQAVIHTLKLSNPTLVAWSYAGLVACDYVAVYGDNDISGINFVNAGTMAGTEKAASFYTPERKALTQRLVLDLTEESVGAIQDFLKLCFYRELTWEEYYFTLGFNVIVPPYVRKGLMSRHINNDDTLRKIQKPVLITYGMKDKIFYTELVEHTLGLIKHAKVSFYQDAGHSPFWEESARFNMELRDFIAGCAR